MKNAAPEENKTPPCCSPTQKTPCCPPKKEYQIPSPDKPYVTGSIETKTGNIPQVAAELTGADKWGNTKVRLGIGRDNYKVEPGLYAVGNPDNQSAVLVSANYKLSFDTLRKELKGLNAWILVLDTRGINVWCAAGKGAFGTTELAGRIETSGLTEIVAHRKLIVPQLGAVGVSAHQVKKRSGFSVSYGPVRARDIPGFLENGLNASPEMRRVRFSFFDRMQVMPVEMVQGFRYFLITALVFFVIAGFTAGEETFRWTGGIYALVNLLLAYLAGTMIGPLLLPWLPGRSFSVKGMFAALLVFVLAFFTTLPGNQAVEIMAWWLMMTSLASFLVMNFTGASTYTSLSGVKKEMKIAIPIQASGAIAGVLTWIAVRLNFI
jgi:acetyl-CoA decarbonylase/synthase complex subunit gamma